MTQASVVALQDIDIDIEDIAQGLANQCRFNGQTSAFFSIAQHGLLVASLVPGPLKLATLLRDAPAAYIGDIGMPFESSLFAYRKVERKLQAAIACRFGLALDDFQCMQLKSARLTLLATKRRDLIQGYIDQWEKLDEIAPLGATLIPLSPDEAKRRFLDMFHSRRCPDAEKI
jgi:5'-deoxynucleotidase YfbR-like HD superfamily hydrolase